MEPKKITDLDPKLKEAYERVMGTSFAQPPQQSQPIAPQPQPSPAIPMQQTQPIQPMQSPQIQQQQPAAIPMTGAQKQTPATNTFVGKKLPIHIGKPKISPVIFLVGGVVFFIVYTIFWLKFFKVSVPFLPL